MTGPGTSVPATVLDRLMEQLRANDVSLDGQERAAAVLWTDPKAERRPLIELILRRVEELPVLGDHAPMRARARRFGFAAL